MGKPATTMVLPKRLSGRVLVRRSTKPSAIVVVLGHLGATKSQMDRYMSWYNDATTSATSRTSITDCHVIGATSPPFQFLCNNTSALERVAHKILDEAARLLREQDVEGIGSGQSKQPNPGRGDPLHEKKQLPIIVHSMSNGGCFLLEQMERILLKPSSSLPQELVLRHMKWGSQIFDSCPCYIRTFWWNGKGTETGTLRLCNSFPHPFFTGNANDGDSRPPLSYSQFFYTFGATLALSIWCGLTGSFGRPYQFWSHMEQSRVCDHQVYIYTTTDLASDAAAVDRLIQVRRHSLNDFGLLVQAHRYHDSQHCRLDVDHPTEYQQVINDALQGSIHRASAALRD
jgi:Eukaryotic protein of unknown function (DUF829)